MCRSIKTLFNFKPPATEDEIRAASLQFVRKLSGYNKPSQANEEAFNRAVEQVAAAAHKLLDSLQTSAEPRDRDVEAARARARAAERFGTSRAPSSSAPTAPAATRTTAPWSARLARWRRRASSSCVTISPTVRKDRAGRTPCRS
jgi:hypothetical protein